MKNYFFTLLGAISLFSSTLGFGHGHIDAGTTNNGNTLTLYGLFNWDTIYTATYQDYIDYSESATGEASINALINAGYNFIFETTFTSLNLYSANPAAETAPSRYSTLGAFSGSYLQLRLVGFSGPGEFSFWEGGNSSTTPTWTVSSATDLSQNSIVIDLTQTVYFDPNHTGNTALQNDLPGISSPYGHRHGRRFGVNEGGDYEFQWQVVDREGVYQDPSAIFTNSFNAIPEPSALFLMAIAGGIGMYCLRSRKKNC